MSITLPAQKEALAFLRTLRDGAHNLVAIEPDSGAISAATSGDMETLAAFVEKHNGKRNLYYSVNRPRADAGNKKLTKGDIEACEFLYVDIDPPADGTKADIDLSAIREAEPSFIVDSGNGYNALWRIEPTDIETAEAHGRGLVKRFGGDPGVWDAPRILRLPGTVNIPNAKKRDAGRVKCEAKLIHKDLLPIYTAEELAPPVTREKKQDYVAEFSFEEASQNIEMTDLPADLRSKLDRAKLADEALALHLDNKNPGGDETRSGVSFRIAEDMHRLGFSDQEIANVLFAHPDLYGADWEARRMRDAIRNSAPDYSGFELDADEIDRIMSEKPPILIEADRHSRGRIKLISVEELLSRPPPEFLIDQILPERGVGILAGAPGSFKSFLALAMGLSISTGRNLGDGKVKQGPVWYLANEGQSALAWRVEAWRRHHGVEDIGDFLIAETTPDLGQPHSIDMAIADLKEAGTPRMIVIDTFIKAAGGVDINSAKEVSEALKRAYHIADAFKCFVLIIDHLGKDAQKGVVGSYVKKGNTDFVGLLTRTGDTATLLVDKQKDGEDGIRFHFKKHNQVVSRPRDESFQSYPVLRMNEGGEGAPTQSEFIVSHLQFFGAKTRDELKEAFLEAFPGKRKSFNTAFKRSLDDKEIEERDGLFIAADA